MAKCSTSLVVARGLVARAARKGLQEGDTGKTIDYRLKEAVVVCFAA
jgi:hypothetical protein